jgi:hypothetical protein
VEVEWHVPTEAEIAFALQLLQEVTTPAMLTVERLIDVPASDRDKIWRNDFVSTMLSKNQDNKAYSSYSAGKDLTPLVIFETNISSDISTQ